MRMHDLERETFEPQDLTFHQLKTLTPWDPDWRNAQFLVLKTPWSYQKDERKIVIVCGQSRVKDGVLVHCVDYNTGEAAWLSEASIADLQWRDFTVLPKMRP